MSRRHQIRRQWEIIRYLEAGGTPTLSDLTEVVNAQDAQQGESRDWSESTLRRDLEDLIQAGFPILRQTQGGAVRWRFPEGYRNSIPDPLLPSQWMVLYYARRSFDAFRETPFRQTHQSLLNAFGKVLPVAIREFLDGLDERFGPYSPPMKMVAAHQRIMEDMAQAADERRCVELLVQVPGRTRASWRRLDPYGVWYHLGQTLIMGYMHETQNIELLRVDSIREIRATDDVFQLPLAIDFRSVLMGEQEGHGVGPGGGKEVVLRCSGDAAARVREAGEQGWLPLVSQEGSEESVEDGEEIVRFSVESLDSVRSWLLSLGGGVEVVSPPELRQAVAKELREAWARYRPAGREREKESETQA
jgi:predicted DNA-binding transcriptional regulator YafY